jgi:hypothetical protein
MPLSWLKLVLDHLSQRGKDALNTTFDFIQSYLITLPSIIPHFSQSPFTSVESWPMSNVGKEEMVDSGSSKARKHHFLKAN